jgi:hypothetical protein
MDNVAVPLIAAVRVDTQWASRSPFLRCLARLTRELTPQEREQLRRFSEFSVSEEDGVTYDCRPEEAETFQKRLAEALVTAAAAATAALEPRSAIRRPLRRPGARARARSRSRVRKTSPAAHQ